MKSAIILILLLIATTATAGERRSFMPELRTGSYITDQAHAIQNYSVGQAIRYRTDRQMGWLSQESFDKQMAALDAEEAEAEKRHQLCMDEFEEYDYRFTKYGHLAANEWRHNRRTKGIHPCY